MRHISYMPLWHTLLNKNMKKEDLRIAAGLTTNMIANMGAWRHWRKSVMPFNVRSQMLLNWWMNFLRKNKFQSVTGKSNERKDFVWEMSW